MTKHWPGWTRGPTPVRHCDEVEAAMRDAIDGDGAIGVLVMAVHEFGCVECHNSDMKERCPIRLRLIGSLGKVASGG